MAYLLDADWVLDALVDGGEAAQTLIKLAPEGIAISVVTFGEISTAAFALPHPVEHVVSLCEFLAPFQKLDLSQPIMKRFAALRCAVPRQGQPLSDYDLLLAATALHHDLIVLTHRIDQFKSIAGLKLYSPSPS